MYADCDKFHLVAHSYGSIFATRIASILESHGKQGHITYVEGSPAMINSAIKVQYAHLTDEQVDNKILKQVADILGVKAEGEKFDDIFQESSWPIKILKLSEITDKQQQYSVQYVEKIINALRNRIRIILSSDFKLTDVLTKSTATLVKAAFSQFSGGFGDDFNLKDNIQSNVSVFTLDGDHFSVLENAKLIEILHEDHDKI